MRIIVGMSGASGAPLAWGVLKALRGFPQVEIHLIVSETAFQTLRHETQMRPEELFGLADAVHDNGNLAADISSGSFVTEGMIIVPCSMKTVAGIVSGYAESLLLRAADVCLKENRRLVLAPREAPLSRIHLRNLAMAADYGCVIIPPVLTFYNAPQTVEDHIQHIVGKILIQFGLESGNFVPWKEPLG